MWLRKCIFSVEFSVWTGRKDQSWVMFFFIITNGSIAPRRHKEFDFMTCGSRDMDFTFESFLFDRK